jgi:hypothetical protein
MRVSRSIRSATCAARCSFAGWHAKREWHRDRFAHLGCPGRSIRHPDPYAMEPAGAARRRRRRRAAAVRIVPAAVRFAARRADRERSVIRMPSTSRWSTTRCCTPTPRASCIWSPTRATRARWCSGHGDARCVDQPAAGAAHHEEMDFIYDLPLPAPAASVLRRCARSRPTR